MSARRVQWSDLPKELLAMIGTTLETHTDVIRFRPVCSSWRSSIPPFPNNSPSFPIKVPHLIIPVADYQNLHIYFTLTESTVYRLEPPQENSQSPAPISSKGWLVKVEESELGKMRLLNPLSKDQNKHLPPTFPKVLNLLDYRFSELSRAYTLQYVSGDYRIRVNKAIFSSNSACTMDDCLVLVICYGGRLALWKFGAEKWTLLGEQWCTHYTDIILYKGQFHAIDRWGEVVVIDSSLKLTTISSPIYEGAGSKKHFVESCGNLYVVDRYLDTDRRTWCWDEHEECYYYKADICCGMTVDFKVYKLNEEEHKWVGVKSLGDRVLFVGDDCSFFVSAQESTGCKGNCIYFTDENLFHHSEDNDDDDQKKDDDVLKGLHGHSTSMFNLEDGNIGKLASFPGYSQIFWPPPTWLMQNSCLSAC